MVKKEEESTEEEEEKLKELFNNKTEKLPDRIDDYFTKLEGSKEAFHSRELFRADNTDVDLKTDLSPEEISHINTLMFNDRFLVSKGLPALYNKYIIQHMRLKFSLERKSRGEFVSINKDNKTEEALNLASGIANISNVKK